MNVARLVELAGLIDLREYDTAVPMNQGTGEYPFNGRAITAYFKNGNVSILSYAVLAESALGKHRKLTGDEKKKLKQIARKEAEVIMEDEFQPTAGDLLRIIDFYKKAKRRTTAERELLENIESTIETCFFGRAVIGK